jgi:2-dehydropantoate 2-reductase
LCTIAATLDEERAVVHMNKLHLLSFGERAGGSTERIAALTGVLADAGFDARPSDTIVHDMWEKWVLLATLASATCLMRASVGDIVASPGGRDLLLQLLEECRGIATSEGFAPRPEFLEQANAMLTTSSSPLTASMFRDIENNARIEAEHVAGDLLRRRRAGSGDQGGISMLRVAFTHMKAYEARRSRLLATR